MTDIRSRRIDPRDPRNVAQLADRLEALAVAVRSGKVMFCSISEMPEYLDIDDSLVATVVTHQIELVVPAELPQPTPQS